MAVIFKIAFIVLALCAIAYAFPAESSKTQTKHGAIKGPYKAIDQKHIAEKEIHEQHVQQNDKTTHDTQSRPKRASAGCVQVGKYERCY